MTLEPFLGLAQDAALLMTAALIFDLTAAHWRQGERPLSQVPVGIALGFIGVITMLTPWTFAPGIVFDTRSVLLSLTGLFFGPLPAAIAMAMTALFRLIQGGAGAWTGVTAIVVTGAAGLAWRHLRRRPLPGIGWRELYGFGLAVHLLMLAAIWFTLPREVALKVLSQVSLPVLAIYPLATALLGALMAARQRRAAAGDQLREAELRFRTLANAGQALIWTSDREGRCDFFNQTWLDFTGRPLAEELGERWIEGVHPGDRARCLSTYREAFARRERFSMAYRLLRHDGEYRWLQDDGSPRYDSQGRFLGFIGYGLDITDHMRTEKALREREAETRGLLQAARAVMTSGTFPETAHRIFDACREVTGAASGYVALLSPDGEENQVLFLEAGGLPCTVDPTLPMPIRGLREVAYREARVVYENGFMQSDWVHWMPPGHVPLRNVLFAPLIIDGAVAGVMGLANKPADFTAADAALAGAFGDLAALALQRTLSEARLEKERRDLLNIIEGTNAGTWEWNVQSGETVFNERWAEMLGYRLEELSPTTIDTWQALAHPEDLQEATDRLERHFSGTLPLYDCQMRMRHKKGHWVWIHDRGRVITWTDDGKPLLMFGTHMDISDRKQMEADYQVLFREMLNGFALHEMLYDLEGRPLDYRFLAVNPAFERLTGLKAAEVIGRRVLEIMPDTEPYWIETFGRVALTGNPVRFESESRSLGKTFMVSAFPHAPGQFACLFEDITERKRTEDALRKSEALFRNLFEQHAAAKLLIDPENGRIIDANAEAARLYGWSREQLRQMTIQEINTLSPEEVAREMARARSLARVHFEFRHRRADGSVREVEVHSSRITADGGTLLHSIIHDITDRKQAEAALQETNRRLEAETERANALATEAQAASVAKSEFLANMSHEIRTPMNGVIGMTGLLLDTDLSDEQRHYAETVRGSAESLLNLINDILDFSKIEARQLDLEMLNFDLRELLDTIAAAMAVRAHEKGLELFHGIDPEVPGLLRGDPGRLRQVLTNLVGNAIKFTPRGEVTLRVSLASADAEGALLRFDVHDTGIGIPAEKQERLWEQFFQVDASITRRYGGTGLGLAIARQLVEMMGGRIGVESREGEGSTFWFTARLATQPAGSQATPQPPADLGGVAVLVVDDNPTNREILVSRLAAWGMRPAEAPDGETALERLRQARGAGSPFRIVITDMQMPGMDGEMLGRAIRSEGDLAATQMVLLKSLGTRTDADRLREIGFDAHLTKPVGERQLRDVIAQLLAQGNSAGRPADTATAGGGSPGPRPAVPPEAPPAPNQGQPTDPLPLAQRFAGHRARILLAEDNITNQQVALGILRKMGLNADTVANGEEVLDAQARIPYDLILMDVQMPGLDGLEATRRIRDPRNGFPAPNVPIIAMTAHAMQGDRERCLAAGMNDYLAKPVTPRALAEILDKWLKGPPAGGPAAPAARASVEKAPPPLDRAALRERLMGDDALAEAILAAFLEDIPRQIALLKGFLAAGDLEQVKRQAHTLKGAAANVGAEPLRAAAQAMEQAVGVPNAGDRLHQRLADLEGAFARLRNALEPDAAG